MSGRQVRSLVEAAAAWSLPAGADRTPVLVVAMGATALLGATAAALLLGPLPTTLLLALAALGVGFLYGTQRTRLLHRLGAVRAADARLLNLVEGVAGAVGRRPPDTYVAPEVANAWALRGGDGGTVVVGEALLERLGRTELEGLLALCIARLEHPAARAARLGALAPLTARAAAPLVGPEVDAAAAAVTRYPPAVEAALAATAPPPRGTAAFAVAGGAPWDAPLDERRALLTDL
ncbi:MAG TPA: hypothetical protein VM573_03645 [Actinomycetota bacterium]|jgi:hypothetical protein|nr:hypothetical protein [Actinomycetota bacterium]